MRVAILDDYQNVALSMADWSDVAARAEITVFNDHLADPDAVVERLAPFDVVCVMRERTPLPRDVIERLPRLKMIASTGPFNAAVDVAAAKERGIYVSTTGGYVESTVELTWALILATARRIVDESVSVRSGGWQTTVGPQLGGSVLGVLGLGRIGSRVAHGSLLPAMRAENTSERPSGLKAKSSSPPKGLPVCVSKTFETTYAKRDSFILSRSTSGPKSNS